MRRLSAADRQTIASAMAGFVITNFVQLYPLVARLTA